MKKKKQRVKKVVGDLVKKTAAIGKVCVEKVMVEAGIQIKISELSVSTQRLKVGVGAGFLTPLEFKAKREGSDYY